VIDWALTGDAWIFRENGKVFDTRQMFAAILLRLQKLYVDIKSAVAITEIITVVFATL